MGALLNNRVLVVLCECGPLLAETIDFSPLEQAARAIDGVADVQRFSTLCSEDGKAALEKLLLSGSFDRVVVVGCSPHQHEATFRPVLTRAGMNPFLLTMVNVREQCAWVCEDRATATEKAKELLSAAVTRCRLQQPLEVREIDANPDLVVIGSGVAGLQAALLGANAGRNVVLVEQAPSIGGRTAMLSDIFPGGLCASCMLEPVMDEALHHPRIELLTCSKVEDVVGCQGNFTVRIRKKARHVAEKECYGCGTCHEACPVEVPDPFGSAPRKAIFIPYPGALPHVSVLDEGSCLRFRKEGHQECEACAQACPFGNIDLQMQDQILERQAGAIVLATGSDWIGGPQFPSSADRVENLLSLPEFERLFHPDGPTHGQFCLADGRAPRSMALIADTPPSELFLKIISHVVSEARKKCPDLKVDFLCCTGETSIDPSVHCIPMDRGAEVKIETHGAAGLRLVIGGKALDTDLAVWVGSLAGSRSATGLLDVLRLDVDSAGFVATADSILHSFSTRAPGIFVAGCAQSPKNIRESATQGAAAAGAALSMLPPGCKITLEPYAAVVSEESCSACGMCVSVCSYKAIIPIPEKGNKVRILETLCHGCGTCVATCPGGAISAPHFTDAQILAEIGSLLEPRQASQSPLSKEDSI